MRLPVLHAHVTRLRESVIARLLLTLVLALGAVGTFQYFVVGGRVESDLIREHAAVHAADTRALAQRAEAAAGDRYSSPLSEVAELLSALAERPDTDDVVVVDKDGSVLASPIAGQVGTHRDDPLLRQVARTGRPIAGASDGKDRHAYMEPLSLLGRDVVFAEYRSSDALASGVAAFRRGLGLFVVLSLLIALPLFYVLGGCSAATVSPTSTTTARSRTSSRAPSPIPRAMARRSRSRCSTSTTSSSRTTATAISTATACCASCPGCCATAGRVTAPSASAATSSHSCSRTPTRLRPTSRSPASAPRSSVACRA